MSADVKGLFAEAAKVTVVAVVAFFVSDLVEAYLPDAPKWLLFAVPAFLTAFAVGAIWMAVTAKAHLDIHWSSTSQSRIDQYPLIVHLDSASDGQGLESFWIRVKHVEARGLGKFALQRAASSGLRLRVEVLHTQMAMTVESGANGSRPGLVVPGNYCSVEFALQLPTPATGTEWASARVDFQGLERRPDADWSVRYTVVGMTGFARQCAKLIKVDSKVVSVVENWS